MKDKEKQLVNEIKQDFKMHEEKHKQIEETAKIIALEMCPTQKEYSKFNNKATCYFARCRNIKNAVDKLTNAGYRKLPEDSVVLSREEYEKLKSLYDTQKGAIMTSSIGDLPLTVEGLRKAVDEITRVNRVETELQELNIKYYNEAKDLRRKLKEAQEFWKATVRTEQEARKETAEKILDQVKFLVEERNGADLEDLSVDGTILEEILVELAKQFGVDIKE